LILFLGSQVLVKGELPWKEEFLPKTNASVSPIKGVFLALNTNSTQIFKIPAFENNLCFGIILNSNVSSGIKLAYFTDYNGMYFENVSKNLGAYMKGGFVGLLVEPVMHPQGKMHLAFPITFAGGLLSFSQVSGFFNGSQKERLDRSTFLLIQPGTELQWDFYKNFTLCIGVNYRHSSGLSVGDMPYDILDGLNLGLGIKYVLDK
jgi:hypothetical protein